MEKGYTTNQIGAIATLLGGTIWVLTAYASADISGWTRIELGLPILIPLILIPLYLMRKRPAFIIGIINSINGLFMTAFFASAGGAPHWFEFTQPLLDFSFVVVIIIILFNIYFSFKTYRELGAKVHLEPTYTNYQVGAISTLLAVLIWGITSQGFEFQVGIIQPIILVPIAIGWILLPFYFKRARPAFSFGVGISIIVLIGFSVTHYLREEAAIFPSLGEATPLPIFSASLYYIISSITYTVIILCMLFSYLTYKELK